MIAIELRFLGGRFHATPWGRHVNEGAIEWPPSPWRLARALIANWRRKHPQVPVETVRALVGVLASSPEFYLPPAVVAHTRHYMRRYRAGKSDMVFDSFLKLDRKQPVVALWRDYDLPAEQVAALETLLSDLGYFGRAESWVDARVLTDWQGETNCRPAADHADGGERVQVLSVQPAEEYAAWRAGAAEQALATLTAQKCAAAEAKGKDPEKVRLSDGDCQKALAHLPEDLLEALHADTADLRKQGWNTPPGSVSVPYLLPPNALQGRRHFPRQVSAWRPTVARFAVAGTVRPRLTETIYVAETMRQALMRRSHAAMVFAGKDEHGTPLRGHQHAFILPADDDQDGRLDHIVVYGKHGFDHAAQRALAVVNRLRQTAGRPDVQLVLIGLGDAEAYGGYDVRAGMTPQLATSRTWVSRTPFLLSRHPKRHKDGSPRLRDDATWMDGPEDQLRRALQHQGFPDPAALTALDHVLAAGKPVRWLSFAWQRRDKAEAPAVPQGFGFRLEFAEPVQGPIALGYGCHFGLGQFAALPE